MLKILKQQSNSRCQLPRGQSNTIKLVSLLDQLSLMVHSTKLSVLQTISACKYRTYYVIYMVRIEIEKASPLHNAGEVNILKMVHNFYSYTSNTCLTACRLHEHIRQLTVLSYLKLVVRKL